MSTSPASNAVQIRSLQREVRTIHSELAQLRTKVEDSLLTADEVRFLDEMFAKVRRGDRSDFVRVDRFPE